MLMMRKFSPFSCFFFCAHLSNLRIVNFILAFECSMKEVMSEQKNGSKKKLEEF
jgi:hypothetical protein